MCPPDIYGKGKGLAKTRSVFVPMFIAESKKLGNRTFYFNEGTNTRSWVHIDDLMQVYLKLVEAAASGGEGATWGLEVCPHNLNLNLHLSSCPDRNRPNLICMFIGRILLHRHARNLTHRRRQSHSQTPQKTRRHRERRPRADQPPTARCYDYRWFREVPPARTLSFRLKFAHKGRAGEEAVRLYTSSANVARVPRG
jgi:nucleoside-diphosphate-sugar epimerase